MKNKFSDAMLGSSVNFLQNNNNNVRHQKKPVSFLDINHNSTR